MIVDGGSTVYLYGHWVGEVLPGVVQEALKRGKDRWNDGSYLARVIFAEMIMDDIMGTTGYGISSVLTDNEHPIIVVKPGKGTIGLATEGMEPDTYVEMTIENFANGAPATWETLATGHAVYYGS